MHALVREKHMACAWQMKCFPQPDRDLASAEALMKKAFEVVSAIENRLTEFASSPFNRINDQAGIAPVAVDEEIWEIVQRALAFGRRTNGVFNIAFATVLRSGTPDDPALKELADFRNIELDETARTIFLPDRQEVMAATVQGETFEFCDMWGTFLMCLPLKDALNELDRENLFGILVDSSARVHLSNAANADKQKKAQM